MTVKFKLNNAKVPNGRPMRLFRVTVQRGH